MPGMFVVVKVMVLAVVEGMIYGMEWQKENQKLKRTAVSVEKSMVTDFMP